MSELLGKKVLLATDGSEGAEPAARAAVEVAEGTGSALHVVYVEPLPAFVKNGAGAPGYDHELYEKIEEEAGERLRKLTWRVKVGGGTVAEAHLRMGVVADEIVDLADQLGAGLIVVGSRGLGMMRRALGGSVSESVVRHAPCPVMVVRTKSGRPGRRGGGGLRMRRAFSQEAIAGGDTGGHPVGSGAKLSRARRKIASRRPGREAGEIGRRKMLRNPLWVTSYGVAPIPLAAGAPRRVPLPGVNAKASGSGDRGHRPHRRRLCAGTCLPGVPSAFDGRETRDSRRLPSFNR